MGYVIPSRVSKERLDMSTKTVLIDDMDGGEADVTIAFIVNGDAYSLDLSKKNADKFNKALEPFIEAAQGQSRARLVDTEVAAFELRSAIREWARKRGLEVSERGRIPQDIVDAYNKTHKR
jgi:hypothetical protein